MNFRKKAWVLLALGSCAALGQDPAALMQESTVQPGIGDDCRGLAVMLGVIKALNDAKVQTAGSITFVADVGEEGLGDLRGVKHLFHESLKGQIDKFISEDGTGLGITHVGVGSYRY